MNDHRTPSISLTEHSENSEVWLDEAVEYVVGNPAAFGRVRRLGRRRTRGHLEQEADRLADIAAELADAYGSPDLGNKADPVDEIVYIALSRRTRESAYQRAYDDLKARWQTWEEVAHARERDVAATIASSGLGQRKARSIQGALLRLEDRFGRCCLPVEDWSDAETASFLESLPEVGPKSAACIMAMALGRRTFAVDAHVGRVLSRLRLYAPLGLDLAALDHKQRQAILPPLVPPALRRDLT